MSISPYSRKLKTLDLYPYIYICIVTYGITTRTTSSSYFLFTTENIKMSSFFFVFLLSIALFAGLSEAGCPKQVLAFQNGFATSHDILQVHCKSGDDDLGVHFVKYGDPVYSIRFGDNVFIGTYWNCFIRHGPNMEYFLKFDAYTSAPFRKCGQVHLWIANEDGIYFSEDGKPEEKRFDWTKV